VTDLERLVDFLLHASVPYKTDPGENHSLTIRIGSEFKNEAGSIPAITGYWNFEHNFIFDANGTLIESGTWE
jgi:hypothetical protein